MGFHAAGRIVSCSVVMLTRFPTICDYRQTRSPLEKGLLDGDYLIWAFIQLRRIVPLRGTLSCAFGAALLQGPTRWGLSHMSFHAVTANCASSRHSILRLWRGPSPRAYSMGIIAHELSCRYGELCLFEALYPAPLARPFSKGLLARDYLTFAFMPPVGPYLALLSC